MKLLQFYKLKYNYHFELKEKDIHTCIDSSGIMYHPGETEYNKTLDKLLNVIWLRSGNVVHEQKRANGGSRHNNLRFVLIALVFGAIVVGLYFALPHIGRGLEWLLKNL